MGKKAKLSFLFLIGMIAIVIGFCCPMFKLGPLEVTGLKFINFEKGTFITIGACLIFFGGIVGAVWGLLPAIGIKLPALDLVKWIAVLAVLAGVAVLIIGCMDNKIYQAIGKQFFKHAIYGTYLVIGGWAVALVGKLTNI